MSAKSYPLMCRIRAEGSSNRMDILDDIGEDPWFGGGISAAAVTDKLSGLRGPLDVHISSQGGMVGDGLAIYNALASYKGPVTTYNDGIAASVASVIMQAGSRRVASPVSVMMVHDAWGDPGPGNAADMAAMAEALSKNSDVIARAYADRAGGTVEQWRGVMQATKWYDADEALAAGLIDEIAGGSKLAAPVDLDALAVARAPSRIMAQLRAAAADAPEPYAGDNPCPTCKGKKTIRDGNMTCPDCKGSGEAPADDAQDRGPRVQGADGDGDAPVCKTCGGKKRLPHPGTGKNGMVCPGCDGTGVYDPDTGDDDPEDDPDGTAVQDRVRGQAGKPYEPQPYSRTSDENVQCPACQKFSDDDARYCGQCGTQLVGRTDVREAALAPASGMLTPELFAAIRQAVRDAASGVDNSPWDGSKAMANGAASDDPAAFYAGICAGEKSGDKSAQDAWALPYKYHPDDPPNAAGVKDALARLPQTEGLTNEADATKTLQAAMKQVNPDWEPEDKSRTVFGQRLKEMRGAMPPLKGAEA